MSGAWPSDHVHHNSIPYFKHVWSLTTGPCSSQEPPVYQMFLEPHHRTMFITAASRNLRRLRVRKRTGLLWQFERKEHASVTALSRHKMPAEQVFTRPLLIKYCMYYMIPYLITQNPRQSSLCKILWNCITRWVSRLGILRGWTGVLDRSFHPITTQDTALCRNY
jgi:hypothetical protein